MYDREKLKRLSQKRTEWNQRSGDSERAGPFTTTSGRPVRRVYEPTDLADLDYERDLGMPGEYPYTRGIHATGYRGRTWTMRMFAGFGSVEETNARFKYLLAQGQTGLSIAFDLPTLMGYDTDAPEAEGEFGRCGVAVSCLADMETLLDGMPLAEITTSMTINSPAAVIWAMYIAAAEKRGVARRKLGGTIQNDILKEFIAQKEYIFPPEPSMRLVVDTIEFGTREMPKWNTISISGYHIREAGATAVQELAFTLADGLEYVRWTLERGLEIDEFAPRLSFFFNCHNDFFEEVAKFRAARRIWAHEMRERFGAKDPRSWWLRFHTQTAGVSLNAIDPLGGSFFAEALTKESEEEAYAYFHRIEDLGGVIPAIESGFFQREIAEASYRYQREIDSRERVIVGVNKYVLDEPLEIPILQMDAQGEQRQVERLSRLRRERDSREAARCLKAVEKACRDEENVMPYLVDAVNACCTLGEICDVMRDVFGAYQEQSVV